MHTKADTHIMDYRWLITKGWLLLWILVIVFPIFSEECIFYSKLNHDSESEGSRFVRVREDMHIGADILTLRAFPRDRIKIKGIDRSHDHKYFKLRELNDTYVQVLLDKSIEDLVDRDAPQNLLKFRIECASKNDEVSQLTVTVYIEDLNDHFPVFQNLPYFVSIDEATPVGTTIFQGIAAFDRDKPNTPNSDIQYSLGSDGLAAGGPYFSLETPHRPSVVLRRSLDFDEGKRRFEIPIYATDRGVSPNQSNTTLTVVIEDHDDLPPRFTENVYRTRINEYYPLTGVQIHEPLYFDPPIRAFDQDSLNATLAYDIIAGNERHLFSANSQNGILYLNKEIDLEEEGLPANTFVLQLEARQVDSPQKRAVARIEIEILDLNDNAPEFEVDVYNISIVENLPSGFSVLQVNAIDRDQGENAEFFYQMSDEKPPGAFVVDPRSGWITVRDQELLDRESRSSITMSILAIEKEAPYSDRDEHAGVVVVEVTLLDSNDNTPEFEMGNLYEFKVNVDAAIGTLVGSVKASDPDEGRNGMVFYELQHPRGSGMVPFKMDSNTGALTVSGSLRRGRLAVFVEASDQPVNPSERRFSLAVLTIEIFAHISNDAIDFMGAPYEFWVGADVPVGASVGQIRTNIEYSGDNGLITYDLLHSYSEGVPFAVEERSGIVTVIRDLQLFARNLYEFEAVAAHDSNKKSDGELRRRALQTERQITKNGDIYEIDEGIISDSENVMVTNVTIHVVGSDDDRGILRRGTYEDPIEFHVKENLKHFAIGQLLYENYTKPINHERRSMSVSVSKVTSPTEVKSPKKDLFSSKSTRQSRQPYSRALKANATTSFTKNTIRKHRDTDMDSGFFVSVMPNVYFEDSNAKDSLVSDKRSNRFVRSFKPRFKSVDSKRHVVLERNHAERRTTSGEEAPILDVYNEVRVSVLDETDPIPLTEPPREVIITPRSVNRHAKQTNLFVVKNNETAQVSGRKTSVDLKQHLRFVIANQQDVTDKIAITDDGTLMTLDGLDRETRDVYRLTVLAEYSKGFASGAGIYQVTIYVDDVNDNPPTFNRHSYSGIISENSALGSDVYMNHQMIVQDADAGENANFTVSLSGEGSHLFKVVFVNMTATTHKNNSSINSSDNFLEKYANLQKFFPNLPFFLMDNQSHMNVPHYSVRFVGPNTLDRERTGFYALRLIAQDKGGLKSEVKLDIMVADVNDNAPSFERIAIAEQSGILILDASNYLNTYYVKNLFSDQAEERTGQAVGSIDAETNEDHHYALASTANVAKLNYRTVVGTPRLLGSRSGGDYEESDNRAMPRFSIPENVTLAKAIMLFTAVDEDLDKNAEIVYGISAEKIVLPGGFSRSGPNHEYFTIDYRTGELEVVRPLPALAHIYVNLTARDVGGLSDHVTVKFEVIDINDHAPVFEKTWYTFDIIEGLYEDQELGEILATDEDYGANANLTYSIRSTKPVPFSITQSSGILKINRELDREAIARYEFQVVAADKSVSGPRLSTATDVEVNILDLNDNAPEFLAYDEMMYGYSEEDDSSEDTTIPLYKVYLNKNTEPGSFVREVKAMDRDFAGNGNGLVMYALQQHSQWPNCFQIDSREGIITTAAKFSRHVDYEHFNVTVIASDLGSPSMSSTALMLVNLQGVDSEESAETMIESNRLFPNKYFEVEVEENCEIPMELLLLNVSAKHQMDPMKWSIVVDADESGYDEFYLDPKNGSLWLMKPLDRETRDLYQIKVRADKVVRDGRNLVMPNIVYPITGSRLHNLNDNEVRIVLRVLDVNDNAPRFVGSGKPIISVIPNMANFDFPVTSVRATDLDAGINADIRYMLLNEPSRMFGIDAITGHIRVLGAVRTDAQRVYGFDVKATDRRGAADGKSAITNVFVYVLEDNKQVRLVVAGRPAEVEREVDSLTRQLSEATDFDVRVRILEPHIDDNDVDNTLQATDAYIYAVDPRTNAIVDMAVLQSTMTSLSAQNLSTTLRIIEFSDASGLTGPVHEQGVDKILSNQDGTTTATELKVAELASIILGVIVFAGSLSTAICVVCVRYRRRRRGGHLRNAPHHGYSGNNSPSTGRAMSNASTDSTKQMLAVPMRPAGLGATHHHMFASQQQQLDHHAGVHQQQLQQKQQMIGGGHGQSRSRVYMDVPLPQSVLSANQHMDHEACLRYNQIHDGPKPQVHNLDTSVTSLHSSGHDSGLDLSREHSETPVRQMAREMRCEQSSYARCGPARRKKCNCAVDRTSGDQQQLHDISCCNEDAGDSSDSYEDSLKNVTVCRRTSLPKNQGFRRSFRINPPVSNSRSMRHSFSGSHPRDAASFAQLEHRLNRMEHNFREPFHLNVDQ